MPFPGACPTLPLLLRRTMIRHLLCSRSRKILNVFQRIRLRLFGTCGCASACSSFASLRVATSERLLLTPWLSGSFFSFAQYESQQVCGLSFLRANGLLTGC